MKWLGFAVLLLLAASAASKDGVIPARGAVVGWVSDSVSGRPVAGANVFGVHTRVGDIADTSGWFGLDDLPVGRREVRIDSFGYRKKLVFINVKSGGRDTLRIQIVHDPNKVSDGPLWVR